MQNNLPNLVNFYASINFPTKNEVKKLLEQNGWKTRKESWEDFECTNEWSELNLLADENNPILKGILLNPEINYKKMVQLLYYFGAKFQAELYDEDNVLLYQDSNL
nr:hypothetical protein [uncultured Flavobacterium sp.]